MSGPDDDAPAFPKACNCGARYDEAGWRALPLRGTQPSEPGHHLELRVCVVCGSTLSIERPDAS